MIHSLDIKLQSYGVTDFSIEVDLETETNKKYWKNVDCKKTDSNFQISKCWERETTSVLFAAERDMISDIRRVRQDVILLIVVLICHTVNLVQDWRETQSMYGGYMGVKPSMSTMAISWNKSRHIWR